MFEYLQSLFIFGNDIFVDYGKEDNDYLHKKVTYGYDTKRAIYYNNIIKDPNTTGKTIEQLPHDCLIDIINARDSGNYKLENELQGILIYLLADERLTDHSRIYSRIRSLF